jgi:predicted small lipoprotein YifL
MQHISSIGSLGSKGPILSPPDELNDAENALQDAESSRNLFLQRRFPEVFARLKGKLA